MAYDPTADLAFMMADIPGSVPVTLGEESTSGVFDFSDVLEQDGDYQVQTRRPTLVVARGALTDLVRGAVVTVDGTDYTVRQLEREDDGATVRCILAEVD